MRKCNCHALWWETVAKARVSMSDYYQSLEALAKDRYLGKLQLLGLDEDSDPYATHNVEKFIDDISRAATIYHTSLCHDIK